MARDIATSDPECKWTEDALAEKLGVIRQTVTTWISDIRARQKAGRNSDIIRLTMLGWPQEKIAQVVGTTQARVAQIINNADWRDFQSIPALKENSDNSITLKGRNLLWVELNPLTRYTM